jgi:hypothetical protein
MASQMASQLRFFSTRRISRTRPPAVGILAQASVGPIALLRYDQALKEGVDEVAKTAPTKPTQ